MSLEGSVSQYAPKAAVAVVVVDRSGRILLQERDENAPISPNQWGLIGGVQEVDEDPLAAAVRELKEETGLILAEAPSLFFEGTRPASAGPGHTNWHVYFAAADVRDEDIVVGEGRRIVFVAPESIPDLDLGVSAAFFLPLFLASLTPPRVVELPKRHRR